MLDVDPRAGGTNSLRQLQAAGRLPRTLTAVTGSGGLHLIYRHPGVKVVSAAHRFGPGLDVKADGGQIVAAPSIHPATGDPYRWQGNWRRDLELWPTTLTPAPPAAAPTRGPVLPSATAHAERLALLRLQKLVAVVMNAESEQSSRCMRWAAVQGGKLIAETGLLEQTVEDALQAAGEARSARGGSEKRPPNPASEVRATIRGGLRTGTAAAAGCAREHSSRRPGAGPVLARPAQL